MASPVEHFVELPAGRFRYLEWPGNGPAVLLMHGLTAVAEVWGPAVEALGPAAPRCLALDQRWHGQSHPVSGGCTIRDYVRDATSFIEELQLGRAHLVGHSMGGRVAMVLAARYPGLVRSTAIVDIGPERWKANWQQSIAAFREMPASFASEEEALAFAGSRTAASPIGTGVFLSRLRRETDGTLRWRANVEALCETVRSHRSRDFWKAWDALPPPALLVRGGSSQELREHVAWRMRQRNPRVSFVELAGVGHNVPLIAPAGLALELRALWGRTA